MQAATGEAVEALREISDTIQEVDRIAAAIVTAIGQQDAATQEIARNVQEASRRTSDVTANIESVSAAAGQTGAAAGELQGAAGELSRQTESCGTNWRRSQYHPRGLTGPSPILTPIEMKVTCRRGATLIQKSPAKRIGPSASVLGRETSMT